MVKHPLPPACVRTKCMVPSLSRASATFKDDPLCVTEENKRFVVDKDSDVGGGYRGINNYSKLGQDLPTPPTSPKLEDKYVAMQSEVRIKKKENTPSVSQKFERFTTIY